MPTLLSINNYHYRRGGADVAYLSQSDLFEAHGWKVASFSMKHPDNLDSPYSSYFVDEIEYGHSYQPARVLTNAAKSIYSWEAHRGITRLIDDVRPDVAHAHNIYHHLSPSVLHAVKRRGIPAFLTLHDFKLLCPARTMVSNDVICEACRPNNLRQVVLKRCMKSSLALSMLIYAESTVHRLVGAYRNYVDKFIAPSRFIMEKFIEWGWDPEQFVHIVNYADATRFAPEFTPGRAFLYFGRLSPEKGVATLLRASAAARVPLRIVGTGPQEQELRQLARELDADAEFLGFKSGEELWRLIRECRAVVVPSEWYENAPISILEAFCLGKPVIGAAIGGIPEMVIAGRTGLVFESQNVGALTDVLREVATHRADVIESWGRAARRMALECHSPERYYESVSRLYASFGSPVPAARAACG
jgi:glycosyltransferase involved in cell wall biosynthesis